MGFSQCESGKIGIIMTINEIKKDIQRRMVRGINATYKDGQEIIDDSFDIFYFQGNPKRRRKHILPGSAYTPSPDIDNFHAHLEIGYEGDQISYPPGDGTFSGGEVLGATMTGTYGVLGNSNYDEEAFEKIGYAAESNFSKEFG